MNQFIVQALRKFDKITQEQAHEIFEHTVDEMDRLETVLDSVYVGIFVCDTANKLLFTNKFARLLLDVRDFVPGSDPVWRLLSDETIAEYLRATLVAGDKSEDREFYAKNRRGQRRLLSFSVLPLVKLYHVTGTVILVEDITQKREREARLHRAENLAAFTTLAAGMAHEIKNPLAAISIHIQLAQKTLEQVGENYPLAKGEIPVPFSKLQRHFEIATEEVERLNHTITDFLFAVRPMSLTIRKTDINALARAAIELLAVELEERHIVRKVSLDPALPLIPLDARYMKEAMLNLMKNAMEAMTDSGVLSVATERAGDEALLRVGDTGEGMNKEEIEKIFEPYWTTKASGTGLGLTHVFKIIREHRGEITVNSTPGKGSVFTITLPIPQEEKKLLEFKSPPHS